MIGDLSVLKLSSAMARHASVVHSVVGQNIARADIPNARAARAEPFAASLQAFMEGDSVRVGTSGSVIKLDQEMVSMAENAGRHQAAVTIWSKTVELLRLAGQSPR